MIGYDKNSYSLNSSSGRSMAVAATYSSVSMPSLTKNPRSDEELTFSLEENRGLAKILAYESIIYGTKYYFLYICVFLHWKISFHYEAQKRANE